MNKPLKAAAVAAATALGLSMALAPATAQGGIPGEHYRDVIKAKNGCGDFRVVLRGHDDTTVTELPNGNQRTSGYFDFTAVNPVNGKKFYRVASGPGIYTDNFLRARGNWFIQLSATASPRNLLFVDGGTFKYDYATETLYDVSDDTKMVNICKRLR